MWSDISLCFWFSSLWWLVMLSTFPCSPGPLGCLFLKNGYSASAYFLIGLFMFASIVWIFSVFWILSLYKISKQFLSFHSLPLHFVDGFFNCTEAFKFDIVPLLDFCFCYLSFWCQIQKYSTKTDVKELTPIFSSRRL